MNLHMLCDACLQLNDGTMQLTILTISMMRRRLLLEH